MNFTDVMDEFVETIGLGPMKYDEDGSVTLLFDGEHEITFTPDAEDHAVFFHAEIGKSLYMDNKALTNLLSASLLGAKTGGAAFAIQEALDALILWKRYADTFENSTYLEMAINDFLSQVIVWKERLKAPQLDIDRIGNEDNTMPYIPGSLGLRV